MIRRDRELARMLKPRPDPRDTATRFAVVFVGLMGLSVAGLLAYALKVLGVV